MTQTPTPPSSVNWRDKVWLHDDIQERADGLLKAATGNHSAAQRLARENGGSANPSVARNAAFADSLALDSAQGHRRCAHYARLA